jgi:hypothetical protein
VSQATEPGQPGERIFDTSFFVQELREKLLTLESEMSGGEEMEAVGSLEQRPNWKRVEGFPYVNCWSKKPIEGCMGMGTSRAQG